MTLKELRISKGLRQKECAQYLGMSVRNYQNYENSVDKLNTAKYNDIYHKLETYLAQSSQIKEYNQVTPKFYTNVVIGNDLLKLYEQVKKFKKRDCYSTLKEFINSEYHGKICTLYGLRRTGKSTLLFQMLGELPIEETAYIKIRVTDNMTSLTKDLKTLLDLNVRYVFIDEITLMDDFINTAAVLSDIYSMLGMKIVVSGTDSLGFAMANRDELYDRNIMIHTSFIPFKEYARLLGISSVDSYIEYGGTLKIENMCFDNPDSKFDDVSFRDDESTRKYIDTAISRNIQHTLKNDNYGEYFDQLRELYDKGELTNVINRIVENMNHNFLLQVIEDEFKSHDLGSAKDLLLHDVPKPRAYVLSEIDTKLVLKRLKEIVEIKEKGETKIAVTQECIDKVKKYLIMLDLIVDIPDYYEDANPTSHYIFTQPGMRYSIAKALVYSLMQDDYFKTISAEDKRYIIEKILSDVKGRMLEDMVLLEVKKSLSTNKDVFKFKFTTGGEFDMVICDKQSGEIQIYEIKHSDKIVDKQTRFLLDKEKCDLVEFRYGTLTDKYVLYRGKTTKVGEIQYKNVEEFLIEL